MRSSVLIASFLLCPHHPAFAETGLTTPVPLAENITTFPKLIATDAAAQAINTELAALEIAGLAELKACDGSRDAHVTLLSADYFSLFVSQGGMCYGAAHPFYDQFPLTFDLTTGALLDWAKALAKTLLDPSAEDYDATHPLRSLALTAAYLAALKNPDPGCDAAYEMPLDFSFWLDPFGGLLKNLPVLALILTHAALVEER